MTVIAAALDKATGDVWVSADQSVRGGSLRVDVMAPDSTTKMARFGPWLFMFSGTCSLEDEIKRIGSKIALMDDIWLVSDAIRARFFDLEGLEAKSIGDGSFSEYDLVMLVARHGGLWVLDGDLKPFPAEWWVAGSGGATGFGAMWLARWLGMPLLGQVESAVLAATTLDARCSGEPQSGVLTREGFTRA